MDRILRNTPGTVSRTFYEDGVVVDPGTVTLTITAADGTVVVNNATATGSGAAARTYNVTAVQTANLDSWTIAWTSSTKGTLTSDVEVVGGFLFSLAELSAVKPTNQTWTTTQMADKRTIVEQAIEDEYGTALVPRYRLETVTSDGTGLIRLTGPIRTVRSVTINGTALGVNDLANLTVQGSYLSGLWWFGGFGTWWSTGIGGIVIGYEYGLDQPPGRMRQDAIRLARQWLVNGPIDDRALGAASPDGQFSFGLATPGRGGSVVGMPDLDAAIMSSPYRTLVG